MIFTALTKFWRPEVIEVFPKKFNEERFQASLDKFVNALIMATKEAIKEEKEVPLLMPIQKPNEQKINI